MHWLLVCEPIRLWNNVFEIAFDSVHKCMFVCFPACVNEIHAYLFGVLIVCKHVRDVNLAGLAWLCTKLSMNKDLTHWKCSVSGVRNKLRTMCLACSCEFLLNSCVRLILEPIKLMCVASYVRNGWMPRYLCEWHDFSCVLWSVYVRWMGISNLLKRSNVGSQCIYQVCSHRVHIPLNV